MEKIIKCIETISEADSTVLIEQELLSLTQFFDYDFYLLGLSVPESVARSKVLIYNNYPTDWREYYDNNNLANVDPIVKHCFENTEPIHWHQKWTPMVGHISSFLKWLIQLMPRISACRSRLHQG
ncbi:hypothetical protein DI392_11490 [Vibrio albus]|uniref:Transcription factor LuxR-like autoinducer-binding domain-containing protein n=1 Tax=Vibrio albus TaxID=2200953 RepID=A0A2U3B9J8_9VIBR|nr:hypothetical protein DI392_11490 [Vibrio albus]